MVGLMPLIKEDDIDISVTWSSKSNKSLKARKETSSDTNMPGILILDLPLSESHYRSMSVVPSHAVCGVCYCLSGAQII